MFNSKRYVGHEDEIFLLEHNCLTVIIEQNGDIEVTGSPTEKAILAWGVEVREFCSDFCFFLIASNFPNLRLLL